MYVDSDAERLFRDHPQKQILTYILKVIIISYMHLQNGRKLKAHFFYFAAVKHIFILAAKINIIIKHLNNCMLDPDPDGEMNADQHTW